MKIRLNIYSMLCLLLAMMLVAGCKRTPEHSVLFNEIFGEEQEATFRGIRLGDDLESVKGKERTGPKHDDQWGYVYEYRLEGKNRYFLEYITKNKDGKARKVDSIVLNVLLEEKGEASKLFTEMEQHLRKVHGVAEGGLGNLKWEDDEQNLNVALRMLDDKRSISLNYVPLQPL